MKKRHSFIHDIRIAKPCSADWDKMTGDERSRFCGQCKLNVYNISAMSMDEAEKLIVEKEGRLCVRLYRRNDGTVLTKDCPKGLAAARRKLATTYATLLGFATLIATYFGFKVNAESSDFVQGKMMRPTMGELRAPVCPIQGPEGFTTGAAVPPPPSLIPKKTSHHRVKHHADP
jgi:hypothetical protein